MHVLHPEVGWPLITVSLLELESLTPITGAKYVYFSSIMVRTPFGRLPVIALPNLCWREFPIAKLQKLITLGQPPGGLQDLVVLELRHGIADYHTDWGNQAGHSQSQVTGCV